MYICSVKFKTKAMKKNFVCVLVVGAMGLTGLQSCKKDYTCVCKTNAGKVYNSDIKTTKKKAESFCSSQQTADRTCSLQ